MRHHPARRLRGRRAAGNAQDRGPGRGALRDRRAAQSDGTAGDRGQRPLRGRAAELPHSGISPAGRTGLRVRHRRRRDRQPAMRAARATSRIRTCRRTAISSCGRIAPAGASRWTPRCSAPRTTSTGSARCRSGRTARPGWCEGCLRRASSCYRDAGPAAARPQARREQRRFATRWWRSSMRPSIRLAGPLQVLRGTQRSVGTQPWECHAGRKGKQDKGSKQAIWLRIFRRRRLVECGQHGEILLFECHVHRPSNDGDAEAVRTSSS